MTGTDAIFTAVNKGEWIKALELCFRGAGEDFEEKRFCCVLASQIGVSPEDPLLPERLRQALMVCPAVLGQSGGGGYALLPI